MISSAISIHSELTLGQKIQSMNWVLLLLIVAVASVGVASLYSAGGGSFSPWASKHLARFAMGFIGMLIIAFIDIRWWFKLSWFFFAAGMALLVIVEIMGHVGMGAQRWINLGFIQLQPSEVMKISVVMALARYFHAATIEDMRRIKFLIIPALMIASPVALVLLQPDLGTSLMIIMAGVSMLFMAGAPWWLFIGGIIGVAAIIPVAWQFFLHDYQKARVMTFLNPESDPLGAGYHITQSKIALGSGGVEGKGFLKGTQSNLNFLPEKQTDFIFTLWAEEWGLMGGAALLCLFGAIFAYCIWIAIRARQNFARFLVLGLTVNFSLYVFINIAMVMGLIPVVGAPLPLISYGGTSMLAALASFGLIMSASIHRDVKVTRL